MADSKNPDLYDLVRGFQAYVTDGTDFSETPRILHEASSRSPLPAARTPWSTSHVTGQQPRGSGSGLDDPGSVPVEMDQGVNSDDDAYWVMVDDLTTSLRNNGVNTEQSESDETEVYIMTGQAEGITVKVLRRGR